MHAVYPLLLGALLFAIGLYGVLARRNAITVLMAIELLLNAVNVNLIAFGSLLRDTFNIGQIFTLFVITIAAAETGLGLAIVLMIFRQRGNADIDGQRQLAEPLGGPDDETDPSPRRSAVPAPGTDAAADDRALDRAPESTAAATVTATEASR
ncbi:MAG TPA: NADH-quinone oxidoreductase subunit NuoK [Actinocrinis sp.]|uniref:NADH-quinone oxidoreductase subunit NuoK n=1 Tax=Actinocrinis sp. TaxID=1920516 RepID=UPI002DDDAC4C|nr:NADH-quinone oxidoreductase subunit NuoK [Actinocrinis sp.]HEV2345661.1 NADH-quinone oxidoreductase subunit NuoK [Actinocrinis sp.]